MLIRSLILAGAAIVAAQSDGPTPTQSSSPTSTGNSTPNEPCAVIASLQAAQETEIPAQAAFECLDSVPVDVDGNSKLIDELKIIWEWQSEVGWLKNPPKEWENGPLDIESELDNIKQNLEKYSSEYTLQLAIQNITTRTGNFHFNYVPDILQVFSFARRAAVIALSEDGTSLPKLFTVSDLVQASSDNSSDTEISTITEINGEDAFAYLENLAQYEQYIDTDGRLNSMFYKGDTQTLGSFAGQTQYDGPSTNLTFANGTSKSLDNIASTSQDFSNVTDGKSFFQSFCTGSISGASSQQSAKSQLGRLGEHATIPSVYHRRHKRQSIPTQGFPDAVVEAKSGAVAGYFLNGNGYDDVAVLKIITFEPKNDDSGSEFQSTIEAFLSECKKQNKQKLIIDLRENGGGATNLLLDTFMQLFPKEEPFSAQRYRAQDQYELIGDAVNEIYNNNTLNAAYAQATNSSLDIDYRYWAYWHFRTEQGKNFASWDDFNGPQTFNSDNFTVSMRYNYSNDDRVSIVVPGFNFVDTSNLTQPFNASNIVMYTDALCGSSCASFHEELKNIAGIHAVTVGGRPETRPIQTVAGTKGGEVIALNNFPGFAQGILKASQLASLTSVKPDNEVLSSLANTPQISLRVGDARSRLQTQDQVRKGDTTGTPLQYIYEASDCKIFYTGDTYATPDAAWKQAWDAFQDDSKCVANSTKHPSSISGGYKPYGPGDLKDSDLPNGNGTGSPTAPSGPQRTGAAVGLRGDLVVAGLVAVVVGVLQL